MVESVRILLLGDIVGLPGERAVRAKTHMLRTKHKIDFVVVNAENIDETGSGIRRQSLDVLLSSGVDLVTGGDHLARRKDTNGFLMEGNRLLRPLNYVKDQGKGSIVCSLPHNPDIQVAVINAVGSVFMDKTVNPFQLIEEELKKIQPLTKIIVLDFHAEATSEKIAMGWFLDGRVSAVVGTHTHVQTADERILPNGTAYITDLGMTGSRHGVIGRKKENVLLKFLNKPHSKFQVATEDVWMNGVLIDVNSLTGKASHIERISIPFEE